MDSKEYSPWQSPAPIPPPPLPPIQPCGGKATASLVLGIVGLVAWCCPLVGIGVGIAGFICGYMDLNSNRRGMAIAGMVLSGLCLLFALINAAVGAYLGITGQHQWLQQ